MTNMELNLKYSYMGFWSDGLAVVKLNDKYGFINEKGEEVVPCIYDNVCDFYKGLVVVRLDDKYGAINKEGKEVIPLIYDEIYYHTYKLANVVLNHKHGFININESDKFNEFMNCILNIGSRKDTLYYQRYKDTYILSTGCFIGTLEEFEKRVNREWYKYNCNIAYNQYTKIINDLKNTL